jgi:hypothetical protein
MGRLLRAPRAPDAPSFRCLKGRRLWKRQSKKTAPLSFAGPMVQLPVLGTVPRSMIGVV